MWTEEVYARKAEVDGSVAEVVVTSKSGEYFKERDKGSKVKKGLAKMQEQRRVKEGSNKVCKGRGRGSTLDERSGTSSNVEHLSWVAMMEEGGGDMELVEKVEDIEGGEEQIGMDELPEARGGSVVEGAEEKGGVVSVIVRERIVDMKGVMDNMKEAMNKVKEAFKDLCMAGEVGEVVRERVESKLEDVGKEIMKIMDVAGKGSEVAVGTSEALSLERSMRGQITESVEIGEEVVQEGREQQGEDVENMEEELGNAGQGRVGDREDVKGGACKGQSGVLRREQLVTNEVEFRVDTIVGRWPMVKIYDVGSGLEEEEELSNIFHENLQDMMKEEDFRRNFVVVRVEKVGQSRRRKVTCDWVVRTAKALQLKMVSKGMVKVRGKELRVKEYLDLVRCYKCYRFGHTVKICLNREVCGNCSGYHRSDRCDKKGEVRCVVCERQGLRGRHVVWDRRCPVYRKKVAEYRESLEGGMVEIVVKEMK